MLRNPRSKSNLTDSPATHSSPNIVIYTNQKFLSMLGSSENCLEMISMQFNYVLAFGSTTETDSKHALLTLKIVSQVLLNFRPFTCF